MKDIQIGIIGGTRGMGKWFAYYLQQQGYRVHASGSKAGMTAAEMAACCQVVVISVPIGITTKIVATVGPLLTKDCLLMDLTSLKVEPVKAMLDCSAAEVIGCHPLFGPQVASPEGQHVVLCPARTRQWLPWLREVLTKGGALLVETTPEKHDELMAAVQGLNHFNTIMMGMALSKTWVPLSQLAPFTTPFFDIKSQMVKKIFTENPRLYAEIICHNPQMEKLLAVYEEVLKELKSSVVGGDAAGLAETLQEAAARLWPEKG